MKSVIKNILSVITLVLFITVIFTSCHREVCPTFGNYTPETLDIHVMNVVDGK